MTQSDDESRERHVQVAGGGGSRLGPGDEHDVQPGPRGVCAPGRLSQHALASVAHNGVAKTFARDKRDAAFRAASIGCARYECCHQRVCDPLGVAEDRVDLARGLDRAQGARPLAQGFSQARPKEPCDPCGAELRARHVRHGWTCGHGNRASSHASGHWAGTFSSLFLLSGPSVPGQSPTIICASFGHSQRASRCAGRANVAYPLDPSLGTGSPRRPWHEAPLRRVRGFLEESLESVDTVEKAGFMRPVSVDNSAWRVVAAQRCC